MKKIIEQAELGDAMAQYKLGVIYESKQSAGKKPDSILKAIELYEKSASQDNVFAQYNLGEIYRLGDKIKKDYNKAFKWLELASNQGFNKAQCSLGHMYFQGLGVKQDRKKGIELLKHAALNGSENAKMYLEILKDSL